MKRSTTTLSLLLFTILTCVRVFAFAAGDPTAAGLTLNVVQNSALTIQLQGVQVDGHALTYTISTSPSHGTLTQLNVLTGIVIFQPTAGYVGSDSFAYTVGALNTALSPVTSSPATVTLNVVASLTTINGHLSNPDSTPASGTVTWVQVTGATSFDGNSIPAGASVSKILDGSGNYTVSLYPTVGLNPNSYFQMLFKPTSGPSPSAILYQIPVSSSVINQSTLDTNKVGTFSLNQQYCCVTNSTALNAVVASINLIGAGGPANAALSNLASPNINTSLLAQTGVNLGSTIKPFKNLFLYGTGTYGTNYMELTSAPSSTRVLTLPDVTDTVAVVGTNNNFSAGQTITPAANSTGFIMSGGSLTGSDAHSFTSVSGTWNTTGVPTALTYNVTNTASGTGSKLFDFQVGGVTKGNLDKSGNLTLAGGFSFAGSSLFSSIQGSTGTKLMAANGAFTPGNCTKTDSNGNLIDATVPCGGGGGSTSPGGSNTQLQFNSLSNFGGITGATSDGTNVTYGSGNLRATLPQIATGINDGSNNPIFSFTAATSDIDIDTVNGRMWVNVNGAPTSTFGTVSNETTTAAARWVNWQFNNSTTNPATLAFYTDLGTASSHVAITSGAAIGLWTLDGWNGSANTVNAAAILFKSTQAFTTGHWGTQAIIQTTANGATTPQNSLIVGQDGSGTFLGNVGGSNLSGTNTGDQNIFASIPVSGQTTVTPSSTSTALTFVAGTNMTITTDNSAKTVTFAAAGGGGAVSSASNSDGTLTVTPTTGAVVASLNLAHANIWAAQQTDQGATTTSPGFYTQITGDTFPRLRAGLNNGDTASIAFGPGSGARDAFIEYVTTGQIRSGGPDAAAPVAQISSVQNVVAGTSNTAGADRTFLGSQSTGNAPGGKILLKTSAAGTSGTSVNTEVLAVTIDATQSLIVAGLIKAGTGPVTLTNTAGNILGSALVGTDITTVGTIGTGTWQGTAIATQYGGLGANNSASGGVPLFASGVVTMTSTSGTGNFVRVTNPTLVGPTLGAALATSLNGNTFTTGTYTLTGGAGKTFTFNNSITIAGTDSTTMTFPGTSDTLAGLGTVETFTAIQTILKAGIGTTSTDGLVLSNATAAAAGSQQWSPRTRWSGAGWKTTATAASQTVDWIAEVQPIQAATNPSSAWVLSSQVNGGGYTPQLQIQSNAAGFPATAFIFGIQNASGDNPVAFQVYRTTTVRNFINWANDIVAVGDASGATEVDLNTSNGTYGFKTNFTLSNNATIGFNSVSSPTAFIGSVGAANIRHGGADIASPVAQIISFAGVIAGTSNTAGVSATIKGSAGTGTGAGGSIIFQTAPAGTTGSTQNTQVTALTIDSTQLVTAAANFTINGATITLGNAAFTTCTSIGTTANALTCAVSTEKVKQDFINFNNGLSVIRKIQAKTFEYQAGTPYFDGYRTHLGLIAENLKSANPLLASMTGPNGTGLMQPEPMAIHAVEISAIQSLDAEIQKLTKIVNQQQKEIELLKTRKRN